MTKSLQFKVTFIGALRVQEKLAASFGEKPAEIETNNNVNSWVPRPGIVGRSDLPDEEDEAESYPYGALRVKDLIKEWRDEEQELFETDTDDEEEEVGESYAYGALGTKFQIDSVVIEAL